MNDQQHLLETLAEVARQAAGLTAEGHHTAAERRKDLDQTRAYVLKQLPSVGSSNLGRIITLATEAATARVDATRSNRVADRRRLQNLAEEKTRSLADLIAKLS